MQPGLAGRMEQNFHVALAVKGAGVADVVVVVRPPRRYWRSRSSPPSLQVEHEEGARRSSAASSGSALGAIQRIAVFRPAPRSTQRLCTPPRSSGLSKRNSARLAESALPSAMTFDDCRERGQSPFPLISPRTSVNRADAVFKRSVRLVSTLTFHSFTAVQRR
jgi:hypothetical protein